MSTARIALIGLSYRTSPIGVREQLNCATIGNGQLADILATRS